VHRGDGAPIYMAALANVAPNNAFKSSNGYTIITADAAGGIVDVHDRRPVVLSAEDAALGLDLPAEQAEHLLRTVALGAEAFDGHMVDRAVGNVRNQGPQLAAPLIDPAPH
jgi:putative SOS response-associated peptidase YedK